MIQTDEWRLGSVEERLEYALVKVRHMNTHTHTWSVISDLESPA